MDSSSMTLYGLIAIVAGSITSIAIALINRPRGEPATEPAALAAVVEETDDPDLTTVEGIARMVVRQGRRIRQLEQAQADDRERMGAMTRYMHVLKDKIRELGGVVPEPAPRDAHHIEC
ncbi:hypothetical protein [Streptomyces sp. SID4982]|uniref:hypothetical protein n=1 Tax=Streptomyces sp. SID4982 TaxID=2690291 RepID=UPI00137042EB|nr:hypothetical protein [Streptomyces sp. SID4982]MYS15149.1 hypothetical protein [Streptomyces sp. SID4982]